MEILFCDAIGCGQSAAWVHLSESDTIPSELLCNDCWLKLRDAHPKQAACYVVYNEALATPHALLSSPADANLNQEDDVITIG